MLLWTQGPDWDETGSEVAKRAEALVSVRMWHALFLLVGSALLSSSAALKVVTPALSQVVVADR